MNTNIQMEDVQIANFMIMDIMMKEDEQMFITGLVVVGDVEGFTMAHFTHTPMAVMKKLMPFWEVSTVQENIGATITA